MEAHDAFVNLMTTFGLIIAVTCGLGIFAVGCVTIFSVIGDAKKGLWG